MSLYSGIVRNVFAPLALWKRGETRQFAYQREFAATQFLFADELRQLQWRRMEALLVHAYERCPFYRGACPSQWRVFSPEAAHDPLADGSEPRA